MASSRHQPSIFLNLPPELRVKIYRELFAGSEINLMLTQRHSRTVILDWTPPKHVSVLRTSSQIYKESLPVLAWSSRLELTLLTDNLYNIETCTNFKVNFEHLLSSPATSLFLRSALPLVRAMDLEMASAVWQGRLESLEALTSLKQICSTRAPTYPGYNIFDLVASNIDIIDEQFFQDNAWESTILTAFEYFLDLNSPMVKDIMTAKAGTIRFCQCLRLNVVDPLSQAGLEIDLVDYSIARKTYHIYYCLLTGEDETFDTSEALVKRLKEVRDYFDKWGIPY